MPIRFRCPGCEGLLSIATRKAGAEIGCPKCGEALIVPPPPEPRPDAGVKPKRRRNEAFAFEEATTEVDMSSPSKQPEPVGAGVGMLTAKSERQAAPVVRNFLDGDEPPTPVVKTEGAKAKPRSKTAKSDDEPLFERSDFERLLEPAIKKVAETTEAKNEGTKPQPATAPKPGAGSAAEAIKLGLPVAEDGVYVSRGTAAIIGGAILFLLVLSFALGFLAARL